MRRVTCPPRKLCETETSTHRARHTHMAGSVGSVGSVARVWVVAFGSLVVALAALAASVYGGSLRDSLENAGRMDNAGRRSSIRRPAGPRRLSDGRVVQDAGAIVGGWRLDACPYGACPDADKAWMGGPCMGPGKRACCTTRMTNCSLFDPSLLGADAACPHGPCPNPALVARGKKCLGPRKLACCNEKFLECEAVGVPVP